MLCCVLCVFFVGGAGVMPRTTVVVAAVVGLGRGASSAKRPARLRGAEDCWHTTHIRTPLAGAVISTFDGSWGCFRFLTGLIDGSERERCSVLTIVRGGESIEVYNHKPKHGLDLF